MTSFSNILGNNSAQLAVVLTLIQSPASSLLISGESGTGKSTLLRSIFSFFDGEKHPPIISIPSSTTIDMLLDNWDTSRLINDSELRIEKGLLSRMEGKIVLIDNINLHSREVIHMIFEHQSKCQKEDSFWIIATINPNEGAIPSGLLDQFTLFTELHTISDKSLRMRLIKNSMDKSIREEDKILYQTILRTRQGIQTIIIGSEILEIATAMCQDYYTLGHRGELALLNSAVAHAAWMGKSRVEKGDLEAVKEMALAHRKVTPNVPSTETEADKQTSDTMDNEEQENSTIEHEIGFSINNKREDERQQSGEETFNEQAPAPYERQELPSKFELASDPLEQLNRYTRYDAGFGSRTRVKKNNHRGSYRRAVVRCTDENDIAIAATIRMAAPFQPIRRKKSSLYAPKIILTPEDYRYKEREHRTGYHILFVVDASGSMGVLQRMKKVKGFIIELLKKSYYKRDRVAMITFKGDSADLVLPFTKSVAKANLLLNELKTGGRTPLYLGLQKAHSTIQSLQRKEKQIAPLIILLTDGRSTSSFHGENNREQIYTLISTLKALSEEFIIIDTEEGFLRLGLAKKFAEESDTRYYALDELDYSIITTNK